MHILKCPIGGYRTVWTFMRHNVSINLFCDKVHCISFCLTFVRRGLAGLSGKSRSAGIRLALA